MLINRFLNLMTLNLNPFEFRIQTEGEGLTWTTSFVKCKTRDLAFALLLQGEYKQIEIAEIIDRTPVEGYFDMLTCFKTYDLMDLAEDIVKKTTPEIYEILQDWRLWKNFHKLYG